MRRVLQRTRADGNAMCIRRGFPLSLSFALRFPITNTHNFYFHAARTPVSLFLRRRCYCVWHQSFASLIQYTPPPLAEPHWIKYGGRTGKIKSRANRRRSCITHILFAPFVYIYGCCCCCLGNAAAPLEI
jgi:hypothetical protein